MQAIRARLQIRLLCLGINKQIPLGQSLDNRFLSALENCSPSETPSLIPSWSNRPVFQETARTASPFSTSTFCFRGGYGKQATTPSLDKHGTLVEEEEFSEIDEETEADLVKHAKRSVSAHLDTDAEGARAAGEEAREGLERLDFGSGGDTRLPTERMLSNNLDLSKLSLPQSKLDSWLERSNFRMKVVDVNRVTKGSPVGGTSRFSAVCVIGNGGGIIGLGSGKAHSISHAIRKAADQALRTLFFVPRYRSSTILHPIVAEYGKCKVTMYPRSTGAGCKASTLITTVCKLAGLHDIGVKVHGTRNPRNTVKAFIRGVESQAVDQELVDIPLEARTTALREWSPLRGQPSVGAAGFSGR